MSRFARAASLVVLAALGCAEPRPAGLYLEQASYEVVVDGTEVAVTPSGGVRLRSDLGYEIEIERAFLLQSSASLVDCEGVGGDVWDDFVAGLRALATPGRAYAGHGEALDPSAVVTPTYVDLLAAPGALHRTSLGAQVFASTRRSSRLSSATTPAGPRVAAVYSESVSRHELVTRVVLVQRGTSTSTSRVSAIWTSAMASRSMTRIRPTITRTLRPTRSPTSWAAIAARRARRAAEA